MSDRIFSIPSEGFYLFREVNGSLHWQGEYKGMKVIAALPINGGSNCLILLDIGASKERTFENLLCVDQNGGVLWKAELPETNDAFVSFQMSADGLHANTWNGYRVTLEYATGKLLKIKFVK